MATASAGTLKIWFLETRPQFLILTPICVLVGVAAAAYDGAAPIAFELSPLHVVLTVVGALLAHITVLGRPTRRRLEAVIDTLVAHSLQVRIAQRFALSDAEQAHALSRAGRVVGKLILLP